MKEFHTADLCDDNQDKNIQVLSPKFSNYGAKQRFEGSIQTIKLDKSNWGLIELLQKKEGEGKVLVIDVQEEFYGVVGDRLSAMASKGNYEAMIINGYVRDTKETRKIDIGLFALGTCPKRNFEETTYEVGNELNFADITFKEDDYVYCDEDGLIITDTKLY